MRLMAAAGLGVLAVIGVMAIADIGELELAGDTVDVYFPDDRVEALARAAAEGDVAAMNAAIDDGADVNYAGLEGFRPLYWPMHAGNKEGFRALLDNGFDPNTPVGYDDKPVIFRAVISTDGLSSRCCLNTATTSTGLTILAIPQRWKLRPSAK